MKLGRNLCRFGALAVLISAPSIAAAADEPPDDGITDLPNVRATLPFMPLCAGVICDGISQSLQVVEWDPETQQLFADGGGDSLTREQFCETLEDSAPSGCDADNPPSTPAYDPGWVANGCGDGSFKSKFSEAAARLVVEHYTGDLDNPFPGISFSGACRMHDACYSTLVQKVNCDRAFRTSMTNACAAGSGTYSNECGGLASGMEAAVSLFGQQAYDAAQNARECAAWADDMEANECDE